MKTVFVPSVRKGYSMINENLTEVVVTSVFIDFKDSCNNTIHVKHQDTEYTVSKDNFYASVEDFDKGNPVAWGTDVWLRCWVEGINFTDNGASCYCFENGEPVLYELNINTLVVTFDEKGRVDMVRSDDFPANPYETREECLAFNNVTIKNEDGTTETRVGAARLAMLSDVQRDVVNQIVGLMRKASDMGVRIVADWNHTYAFNVNGVADYEFAYCDDYPSDKHEMVNLNHKEFIVNDSRFNICGEEDNLFIKR